MAHEEPVTLKDIRVEYADAREALNPLLDGFDEKESMLVSKLSDSLSPGFKSRVTDSRLSTIILERAARVMAQVPTGNVQALTSKDKGKSALMQLAHSRYIIPNANAQFDHLTKMRMWDLYSMVYGVMPMLYDYSITPSYVGPDSWLLPIRNWLPQPGKLSIEDADYCFVDTMVSASSLKGLNTEVWNGGALRKLLDEVEKGGTAKTSLEARTRSVIESSREHDIKGGKGKAAQVRLTTRYEGGKDGYWVTFAPDFQSDTDEPLRRIKNPHKNGRIPIVLKHCFPLIDSIYGLGDFERGKTLQFAMDSLINLYLDGVKMSIFPPVLMTQNGYIASSIKYQPGAKWLMKEPNAISQLQLSPQGLNTFQATYGFMTGAMLNQNGTTDTAVTSETSADGSYGRTPQALKMQQARESSRDNWDRFMMEKSLEKLYEAQINLLANNQESPINLHIFDAEIKQIEEAGLTDVAEIFESGKAGRVTLTKKLLGGCEYKYILDASTTAQKDQAAEHSTLAEVINAITTMPTLLPAMQAEGMELKVGELFKRFIISAGVPDWEKIIVKQEQQEPLPSSGQIDPATGQPMAPMPQEGNGAPSPEQMAQILSGAPAEAPAPVEEPANPGMEFVMKHFAELPEDAKKAVLAGFKLPTGGTSPRGTDQMIKSANAAMSAMSTAAQNDENGNGIPDAEEEAPLPGTLMNGTDLEALANSEDPEVAAFARALMEEGALRG